MLEVTADEIFYHQKKKKGKRLEITLFSRNRTNRGSFSLTFKGT